MPAFAASKPAMQSGNVDLDLTTTTDQGCSNDGGILFGGDAPPIDDLTTYAGAMTGAWGRHDVALDLYVDQGLLNQSYEGCQEAYAVLCTIGGDPLNLEMAADLTICADAKGDNSTITGGMDLSTVDIEGLSDAWGSAAGTIEPDRDGQRVKVKIKGVVEP